MWWQVGASLVFAAGPVGFLLFAAFSLYKHKSRGNLEYEKAEWPSFTACRESMGAAKFYAKPYALYDYWCNLKVRGGWSDGTVSGRHWSFFIGDFSKFAWFYCLWLFFRKIAISAIMTLSDGSLNAGLAVATQLLDATMLLLLLPYNDLQVTGIEAITGLTNSLAAFSLAMPVWGLSLPGLTLPPGPQFLLVSFGALLAGISSFLGAAIKFVRSLLLLSGLISLGSDNVALNILTGTGAGGLVAGYLIDEAILSATTGNEQDEPDAPTALVLEPNGQVCSSSPRWVSVLDGLRVCMFFVRGCA